MMRELLLIITVIVIVGCSTHPINVDNNTIGSLSRNSSGGTYSDYGGDIQFNQTDKLHHLNVYTGGKGGCDSGAVLYAKPKLDKFMKEKGFSSYNIVKGEYLLFPLSKCELYVKFD